MLKPLTSMVRVLLLFSIIVQARPYSNNNTLCVNDNNVPQEINVSLQQDKPYVLTSVPDGGMMAVPNFFQFSCEGASTLVTVDITVEDGKHTQIITEDIVINESGSLYEIPLLIYLKDELKNSNAAIKSIKFYNNSATPVVLADISFSKMTSYEEIKLDQVVNLTLNRENSRKNYFVLSSEAKDVTFKLYNSKGLLLQKIAGSLWEGNNIIQFDKMKMEEGKHLVVITENNTASGNNTTVMK